MTAIHNKQSLEEAARKLADLERLTDEIMKIEPSCPAAQRLINESLEPLCKAAKVERSHLAERYGLKRPSLGGFFDKVENEDTTKSAS